MDVDEIKGGGSDFSRKMQKDVNCLLDSDRGKRLTSLKKFNETFFGKSTEPLPTKVEIVAYFYKSLCSPLLKVVSDPVEKCRELSLEILISFIEKYLDDQTSELINMFIPIALNRTGKIPFEEPAEEIRLLFIKTLCLLLKSQSNGNTISSHIDDLSTILVTLLGDSFPDVKREAAITVEELATIASSHIHVSLASLSNALLTGMSHQHSKVRTAMLKALQKVVVNGSEGLEKLMKDSILPSLASLVFDRTGGVRKLLIQVITFWMENLSNREPFESGLISILLLGIGDESPEISKLAFESLEKVGADYQKSEAATEFMDIDTVGSSHLVLPPPFTHRPNAGSRALVIKNLPLLLSPVTKDLCDWTVRTRASSASLLHKITFYAEAHISGYLEMVMGALCKSIRDEEPAVTASIFEIACLLGSFVEPEAYLSILLPQARGETLGSESNSIRTCSIAVLACAVKGIRSPSLAHYLLNISNTMITPILLETESKELQDELGRLSINIIENFEFVFVDGAIPNNLIENLLTVLVQLCGSHDNPKLHELTLFAFEKIRLSTKYNSTADLFSSYYESLLIKTLDGFKTWNKASGKRIFFDTLLRQAGHVVAEKFALTLPVFVEMLKITRDPDLRLSFLALLETLIANTELNTHFKPFGKVIMSDILIPNAVWRVGRVAATIRKVSVACQFTLLKSKLTSPEELLSLLPEWQPVLISCLDDDDISTKHLSCMTSFHVFTILQGRLTSIEIGDLYHPLLKLLDDSSDTIILAICTALNPFFKAAPVSEYSSTVIDYTLETLFIHLDDSNEKIQDCVLEILKTMVPICAPKMFKFAQSERSKHRNPDRCDIIINCIDQLH